MPTYRVQMTLPIIPSTIIMKQKYSCEPLMQLLKHDVVNSARSTALMAIIPPRDTKMPKKWHIEAATKSLYVFLLTFETFKK